MIHDYYASLERSSGIAQISLVYSSLFHVLNRPIFVKLVSSVIAA